LSTKAYVLIETSVGKTTAVSDALLALPAIVTVDAVTGPYDIIAVVDAADLTAVGNLVTSDIHTIGGIVRTVTCLSMGSAI
jgi:DNA-binding Lrp family transcriptional regulator